MQSSVFSAFFHVCSNKSQPIHGQCPIDTESWCKYQRAVVKCIKYQDKSQGMPKNTMKIVKPVYIKLCYRELLKRCLDGKTQNADKTLNGLFWRCIPEETFVESNTLELGVNMAVIMFNKVFNGFRALIAELSISVGENTAIGFNTFDKERVNE
ncbi:hypothetical protein AVEN_155977-1 [Araneus ventricosus]|uniref:Uncharacterized protein n=1 Tax=Araneus ventricosus TaxID=182803 RepID=A0A4Y2D721_ARAVE|nr:hypothetical protein AVEN_155977-1 [Araneus ventricosus]